MKEELEFEDVEVVYSSGKSGYQPYISNKSDISYLPQGEKIYLPSGKESVSFADIKLTSDDLFDSTRLSEKEKCLPRLYNLVASLVESLGTERSHISQLQARDGQSKSPGRSRKKNKRQSAQTSNHASTLRELETSAHRAHNTIVLLDVLFDHAAESAREMESALRELESDQIPETEVSEDRSTTWRARVIDHAVLVKQTNANIWASLIQKKIHASENEKDYDEITPSEAQKQDQDRETQRQNLKADLLAWYTGKQSHEWHLNQYRSMRPADGDSAPCVEPGWIVKLDFYPAPETADTVQDCERRTVDVRAWVEHGGRVFKSRNLDHLWQTDAHSSTKGVEDFGQPTLELHTSDDITSRCLRKLGDLVSSHQATIETVDTKLGAAVDSLGEWRLSDQTQLADLLEDTVAVNRVTTGLIDAISTMWAKCSTMYKETAKKLSDDYHKEIDNFLRDNEKSYAFARRIGHEWVTAAGLSAQLRLEQNIASVNGMLTVLEHAKDRARLACFSDGNDGEEAEEDRRSEPRDDLTHTQRSKRMEYLRSSMKEIGCEKVPNDFYELLIELSKHGESQTAQSSS